MEAGVSGYNVKTGVFELTHTKAHYWLRRKDIPDFCKEKDPNSMEYIACILQWQHLEVIKVAGAFLQVKATPEKLWEALSGQPSDPERTAHYYR